MNAGQALCVLVPLWCPFLAAAAPPDIAGAERQAAELARHPTTELPEAERVPVQDAALAAVLADRTNEIGGTIARERKAFVILGPPSAGKSTIADPLARVHRALVIDSDDIKAALPEFAGGLGARRVHAESANLTDDMIASSLVAGENVVLPIVGREAKRVAIRLRRGEMRHIAIPTHQIDDALLGYRDPLHRLADVVEHWETMHQQPPVIGAPRQSKRRRYCGIGESGWSRLLANRHGRATAQRADWRTASGQDATP